MSVVVYDGKALAADCMAVTGGVKSHASKIRRLNNGDVVAWVGMQSYGEILAQWYERGADPEEWPAFQRGEDWAFLIIGTKGKAYYYESEPLQMAVESEYWAWGSGMEIALGALFAGANARTAVQACCRHSATCGGGVELFYLDHEAE